MASVLKVDKLDPQSGTALEIGTSGDTISVPSGATLDISASTLTPPATMPASSGINFTALNATNLGSGTVPTARLGTGTASSSTVLYGDQTYKAEPGGGKILQVVSYTGNAVRTASSSTTYTATTTSIAITPAATTSKILIFFGGTSTFDSGNGYFTVFRDIGGGGFSNLAGFSGLYYGSTGDWVPGYGYMEDSPATTSECTYTVYLKQTGGGTAYWGTESSVSATTLPTNGQSLVCFELGA